ncbi:ABC transporter permease [Granulicella mallensis]|uniref:Putative ABC transport system permease protein n=1 Tax=Granulicella mallensis TaxID=940614 RepID=A0A7W7ZNP0_9BACT|nr:ABC transporter permease [Granulicella mallensis]MBB5063315.1 putative ABC transport system permease protein [Granulicella mallensis]
MNKLIVGNLVHRPLRSVISAFAVAIEVIMILSVVAIFYGILNGSRTQQSGIGMDMIVRPGTAGALLNTSAAAADVRIADVLRKLPHVQVVSPVNIKLTTGASLENISGIDYASYNELKPFVFISGTPFQQPFDAIIDDLEATKGKGVKVGDTIKILNHDFTVRGIVEHGKGGRKYIPLATMDQLDGNPGKAAAFYLKTEDQPKFQEDVRNEILNTDGMQQYSVQTIQEYLSTLTPDHLPGFKPALNVIIGIATIIGFMVIFQSMYTAVMERTREIGILKSMGAGQFSIVSVVLRETMLLAIAGIFIGVVATYVLRWFLHAHINPTLSFQLTLEWDIKAVLIALAGALLGAFYPALKAARKDPIDALSYE